MLQTIAFLYSLGMIFMSMHAAQVNISIKEQEEKAAVAQMFDIIVQAKWPKWKNSMPHSENALKNLLKQYPDIVNQVNQYKTTALTIAVSLNLPTLAQILINAGADINKRPFTPLMTAAAHGHQEITRILIRDGADRDLQNAQGDTALTIATEKTLRGEYVSEYASEYVNGVLAGEDDRRKFLQQEIGPYLINNYLIQDVAKIVLEYAD